LCYFPAGNKNTIGLHQAAIDKVFYMRTTLPIRVKKLIGTFFIVLLVIVYALVAVAIATATLANAPWYAHLLYFMFSGVLWVLPAMGIIKWMSTDNSVPSTDV
jgi:hypothetical protein